MHHIPTFIRIGDGITLPTMASLIEVGTLVPDPTGPYIYALVFGIGIVRPGRPTVIQPLPSYKKWPKHARIVIWQGGVHDGA